MSAPARSRRVSGRRPSTASGCGRWGCIWLRQHLPYERACQLLLDLAGARISTATLKGWVDRAAAGLGGFTDQLQTLLVAAPVAHFDETGGRIEGSLNWIHSASTDELTLYTAHKKRGRVGIDAAGALPDFHGVSRSTTAGRLIAPTSRRPTRCAAPITRASWSPPRKPASCGLGG